MSQTTHFGLITNTRQNRVKHAHILWMKRIIYTMVGGTYSYHRDTKWFILLYEALSNAYTTSCSQSSEFHFQNHATTFHTSHSQSAGFMINSSADFAAT